MNSTERMALSLVTGGVPVEVEWWAQPLEQRVPVARWVRGRFGLGAVLTLRARGVAVVDAVLCVRTGDDWEPAISGGLVTEAEGLSRHERGRAMRIVVAQEFPRENDEGEAWISVHCLVLLARWDVRTIRVSYDDGTADDVVVPASGMAVVGWISPGVERVAALDERGVEVDVL